MTAVATTAHLPPMRTRTGTGRPMPIKPYRHFLVQKNMDRRLSGKNNIQPNPRGGALLSRAPPAMTKISPKRASAVVPRAAQLAGGIGIVYASLTALWAIMLAMAGMSSFDAIAHAMTTIATTVKIE